MRKTEAEYRQFAEECRKLAEQLTRPDDKGALLLMAQAWETLAGDEPKPPPPGDKKAS